VSVCWRLTALVYGDRLRVLPVARLYRPTPPADTAAAAAAAAAAASALCSTGGYMCFGLDRCTRRTAAVLDFTHRRHGSLSRRPLFAIDRFGPVGRQTGVRVYAGRSVGSAAAKSPPAGPADQSVGRMPAGRCRE